MNGQGCVVSNSTLEGNGILWPSLRGGFALFRRPIFQIALTSWKNSNQPPIFCVHAFKTKVDDKSLEKQFEFQPTFGEYLKAMESIKGDRPDIEGEIEDLGEEKESRKFKSVNNTDSRLSGVRFSSEEADGVANQSSQRFSKRGDRGRSAGGLVTHEKHHRGNGIGRETKRELRQKRSDQSMKRISERGKTDHSRIIEGEMWKSESKIQKQNLASNTLSVNTQIKTVEKRSNFSDVSKTVKEIVKIDRYTKETKRREISSDWKQTDAEVCRSEVQRNAPHPAIIKGMGRQAPSRSQIFVRNTENAFERGNIQEAGKNKLVKWNKDTFQSENVGNGTSVMHRKFTGIATMGLGHDADENEIMKERAAFKSFESSNNAQDWQNASKREMEERIQTLAKSLNGMDLNMPEWLFSKMMYNGKVRFSDHSMLRLIQVLGKFGNWRRVLQVIEWLQSHERFRSYNGRYIYTTALNVLGEAKRPVEALNLFHVMRQEKSLYPDLAAYRCIAVILGQAGFMKELFDVIDCMRSPPPKNFKTGALDRWNPLLEPDEIIYNAVLNACARRQQWEGAFWVLQQLKQQGLQPSSTTYGLVMEVMFESGKYSLVHEFFRKVEKSSIPNALNYRVLVNTLWREDKVNEAVVVVQEMERRGIVGSASLYYDLARCLCSVGRCEEALAQINKICKVASKPLVVTYTGLIQACLDVGNVENGAHIFKQMKNFCSPNLVTCNIMLKAYLENRMFEDAKDLFQKMLDDSSNIKSRKDYRTLVIPDNYTFNTMLDALVAEQKWDDFKYVYTQMLHRGYNFNARRHLKMILSACRAGKGELLEITWKHLIQANRSPPASIIKERFLMKLEADDYAAAISCIGTHCTNEHAFSEKAWLDLFMANSDRLQAGTLVRLINELNTVVAGAYEPNLIFQNVIAACKEFNRIHTTEISRTEVKRTILKVS
ncbi:hypothetical protein Scep_027206 [Stephania cephalantha]|uniref:Pentatricopeptide repeat-containing protein n=1 Tax=Stephania cephalantha TaxID=152367 RepID=A0AAP0HIB4_9MAGN